MSLNKKSPFQIISDQCEHYTDREVRSTFHGISAAVHSLWEFFVSTLGSMGRTLYLLTILPGNKTSAIHVGFSYTGPVCSSHGSHGSHVNVGSIEIQNSSACLENQPTSQAAKVGALVGTILFPALLDSGVKWVTSQVVNKKGRYVFHTESVFFFDSCQLGPAQIGCNGKIIITILLSGIFINLQWIHCCSGNGHDPNLSTCKNWEWLEVGRLWHSYGDVHTGEFLNVQVTLVLQVSW